MFEAKFAMIHVNNTLLYNLVYEITSIIKCQMKLVILSQTSGVKKIFENG